MGNWNTSAMKSPWLLSRRLALWTGIMLLITILAAQLTFTQQDSSPISDFVEYWAAGRLNANGENPYSADNLSRLQQEIGYIHNEPMMMWNPPWAIPFIMPFGLLNYPVSRFLWLVLGLAMLIVCVSLSWRMFGGPPERAWLAILISLAFAPSIFVLAAGQISILILTGVVCFIFFARRQEWLLAGLSTTLIAIKPQLLYLFWIALMLWSFYSRNWKVLAGAVLGIAGATAIALIANPSVLSQYFAAIQQPSYYWITPTVGANLRLIVAWDAYWLQFVAPVAGLIWFGFYWSRHRNGWQWEQNMPIIIMLSVATTAFGWLFDQVVILIALTLMVVWLIQGKRSMVGISILFFVTINLLAIRTHLAPTLSSDWIAAHNGDQSGDGWGIASSLQELSRAWGVWVAPLMILWFWLVERAHRARLTSCPRQPEDLGSPISDAK